MSPYLFDRDSYLYQSNLGGDGNSKLQKKMKHDDPDDVSLGEGDAFYVPDCLIKPYLDEIDQEPQVRAVHTVSTPIYLLRGVLGERALAIQFGTLVVAHILESLYTFSLCRKHSTGFVVGVSACPFISS